MKAYQHPVFSFLLKAAGIYVIWILLYDLWLAPAGWLDEWVIDNNLYFSKLLLIFAGYEAAAEGRLLSIGDSSLWVGNPCNAIPLFALFTGFVVAYPGKFMRKLLYIPLGLVLVHLLNIIRVVALSIINHHAPSSLEFNHTYTFTILVYAAIFGLWMFWVRWGGKTKHG